jgi:hypothetical protein
MADFWGAAPIIFVEIHRSFRRSHYLNKGAITTQAISTSNTLADFFETRRRNISEHSYLHTRNCDSLKYHVWMN